MRRTALITTIVLAAAVPAVAGAASGTIRTGYYASVAGVPSADVEFHVHTGKKVPDLVLGCEPLDATLGVAITVHAPSTLRIGNGRISSDVTATIKGPTGSDTVLGRTTLRLRIKHVDGPVHHYVYEGRHLRTTAAWTGTVSSPACGKVDAKGKVKLYGKVTEE